jgi:hypothetical protein
MNPVIQLIQRSRVFLVALLLGCFAVPQNAQAVIPPPDGGYPGGNTAEGQAALLSLTSGGFNTAIGFLSLTNNASGQLNTAVGAGTLLVNTADENTATGAGALLSNTIGHENTGNGAFALFSNTLGNGNTAIGYRALTSNTTGGGNTAIGHRALFTNTTGHGNTALGLNALLFNSDGFSNTATGIDALLNNTTGYLNAATGETALWSNTVGAYNTANGCRALYSNVASNYNTAIGYQALYLNQNGTGNTAIGTQALINNTSGSYNVVLAGGQNLTTGDFNIDIGNDGVAGESSTIRVGNPLHNRAFIAGINGTTVSGGTTVYINSDGQLGTNPSSARFKQNIRSMDKNSEALYALKPVTFRYKEEIDPKKIPQFGLVAEEVEKVSSDLVVRDEEGKPYTVRYDQVNAMLLNEFLKEHRKVQKLEANDAERQREIRGLAATVKEQAALIKKVSAEIAMGKATPNVVLSSP